MPLTIMPNSSVVQPSSQRMSTKRWAMDSSLLARIAASFFFCSICCALTRSEMSTGLPPIAFGTIIGVGFMRQGRYPSRQGAWLPDRATGQGE